MKCTNIKITNNERFKFCCMLMDQIDQLRTKYNHVKLTIDGNIMHLKSFNMFKAPCVLTTN